MPNKKTRRRKYYPRCKENERITGANKSQTVHEGWGRRGNLGFPTDDQFLPNGMKKNERKYKKKGSSSRTLKNKKRCMNGGYVTKTSALVYENPMYNDPDYAKYSKNKLHQYLIQSYNNAQMTFEELIDTLEEKLAVMKKGRTGKVINANPYYLEVTTNMK
jgi:hypothetical protein